MMNESQKQILLRTAKQTVDAAVNRLPAPMAEKTDDPALLAECGCFVTLKNNEDLRGCIGNFTADKPLIEMVREMAMSSARRDPRFTHNPIRPAELPLLEIEISVLSPMEKTDNPMGLELGKHGIFITDGRRSGCFLPQVATETGWTTEEFLNYCCTHKAGLREYAWEDPEVEVYLFTAEVFGAGWGQIK
ncbi:MAG: AmmeMemoRadiSam system protein A [Planctomycetes bacterium]|nr:AmmeMemoRadiSam system protein A [Planctomycetota bacterium]